MMDAIQVELAKNETPIQRDDKFMERLSTFSFEHIIKLDHHSIKNWVKSNSGLPSHQASILVDPELLISIVALTRYKTPMRTQFFGISALEKWKTVTMSISLITPSH